MFNQIFLQSTTFLYNTPNLTDGLDDVLVDIATSVPFFTSLFLAFVFFVILVSGLVSQKTRTGFADFPMWSTIASMSTLLVALPMTLKKGIIGLDTLAIVTTITILSGVWLFFSNSNREV